MLISDEMTQERVGLNDRWVEAFLATYCEGALSTFDQWDPEQVMAEAGIGAVETQSWIAAGQAMLTASGAVPRVMFHEVAMEVRSEEHTSELQSLMRISYAVFCLKKKKHVSYLMTFSPYSKFITIKSSTK